jgi:hypothetical protein
MFGYVERARKILSFSKPVNLLRLHHDPKMSQGHILEYIGRLSPKIKKESQPKYSNTSNFPAYIVH